MKLSLRIILLLVLLFSSYLFYFDYTHHILSSTELRTYPVQTSNKVAPLLDENKNLRNQIEVLRNTLEQDKSKIHQLTEDLTSIKLNANNDISSSDVNGVDHPIGIYCMVPSMFQSRKFPAMSAILRTWGKRCDVLKFFVDPIYLDDLDHHQDIVHLLDLSEESREEVSVYEGETLVTRTRLKLPDRYTDYETGLSAELVEIPMKRRNDRVDSEGKVLKESCWAGGGKDKHGNVKYVACRHIWEKVWRGWDHIERETRVAGSKESKCKYFLKIDDDTYFFPDFLRIISQRKKLNYFGHRLLNGRVDTGFVAGAMVGYSLETLQKVVPVYRTMPNEYGDRNKFKHGRCVDRDGATQELTESLCLKSIGIEAQDMATDDGLSRVTLHSIEQSLRLRKTPDTSYWFWKKKERYNACCAHMPLAFHHYKKAKDMLKVDKLFFDRNERVVRDEFSSPEFKDKVHSSNHLKVWNAEISSNQEKMVSGGTYLARWLEFQYILNVRENLDLFGLFDDTYDS